MIADRITPDAYARAIPPWCGAKTLQEHREMLYCWGLALNVERGEETDEERCRWCDLYDGELEPLDLEVGG